jgi:hypothetical protein
METPKKQNVQNTSITLKECLENQAWLDAYEKIKRDTAYRLKNHYYDE